MQRKERNGGLALAGVIYALIASTILGIAAVIFTAMPNDEFEQLIILKPLRMRDIFTTLKRRTDLLEGARLFNKYLDPVYMGFEND